MLLSPLILLRSPYVPIVDILGVTLLMTARKMIGRSTSLHVLSSSHHLLNVLHISFFIESWLNPQFMNGLDQHTQIVAEHLTQHFIELPDIALAQDGFQGVDKSPSLQGDLPCIGHLFARSRWAILAS